MDPTWTDSNNDGTIDTVDDLLSTYLALDGADFANVGSVFKGRRDQGAKTVAMQWLLELEDLDA